MSFGGPRGALFGGGGSLVASAGAGGATFTFGGATEEDDWQRADADENRQQAET